MDPHRDRDDGGTGCLDGGGFDLDEPGPDPTGPVLSNFLIGGAVGGAIVGIYAGQNRRNQEELRQQANRLATLNRILRDEVLNAVMVINGHVGVLADRNAGEDIDSSVSIIGDQSNTIEEAIEEIGSLTRATAEDAELQPVELATAVTSAQTTVGERFPEADIDVDIPDGLTVWANQRLDHVFAHLLDNAARYATDPDASITVSVETGPRTVVARVADDGPGLPPEEQETLEAGDITEFDDPRSGFGLNVVRLLVESYGGDISTTVDETGSVIEITLARGDQGEPSDGGDLGAVRSYGVASEHLYMAIAAAVVAGTVMGLIMQAMAGIVPVIGALYGVRDPLVGWITHQFHSIVFGMVFVSLVTAVPEVGASLKGRLSVAVVFATFLWLFAAGLVMPFWLQLLGLPASLPNLTGAALVGHLAWGVTLGGGYHALLTWRDAGSLGPR